MILINGEHCNAIAIIDRGFQYGDGLFETIAVHNGQPIFFNRHLARLKIGCDRLLIPYPDSEQLRSEANSLCQHAENAVLKIIITRGSGGRGYRQPDSIQPTRVLSLHPFPDYPQSYTKQGINARFCTTRLGLNPSLAGIKHLNRLEQVLARAEWNSPNIHEGIMLDINDYVIEGTMTNLFYSKHNTLYTASLTQSGIAGIMRNLIIELCAEQNLTVIEHQFTKADVLAADEVFVSNSIIGLWPIKQLDSTKYRVGQITQQLQYALEQFTYAAHP